MAHQSMNLKRKKCVNAKKETKIKGSGKHELRKQQMRKYYHAGKYSFQKVQKFKQSIEQGSYYICVSCNRCHYSKSVVQFKQEKYNLQDDILSDVFSFDRKKYICHTCHKKLMNGNIPAQAIYNKPQVHQLPSELRDVRKLEKAIISRRFLFKKVTIMPKGQMPKIMGAICNVPFDTGEVYNVLPRASDSTGIVMVKLKLKFESPSGIKKG